MCFYSDTALGNQILHTYLGSSMQCHQPGLHWHPVKQGLSSGAAQLSEHRGSCAWLHAYQRQGTALLGAWKQVQWIWALKVFMNMLESSFRCQKKKANWDLQNTQIFNSYLLLYFGESWHLRTASLALTFFVFHFCIYFGFPYPFNVLTILTANCYIWCCV